MYIHLYIVGNNLLTFKCVYLRIHLSQYSQRG